MLPNFFVRVYPTGNKVYYYYFNRSAHKLGSAKVLTAVQAREMARKIFADGIDPRDKREAKELTLGELAEKYKSSGGSLYCYRLVQKDYHGLLSGPASEITQLAIEELREDRRRSSGITCSTANKSVTAIKALLNWAAKRGLIPDNPLANLQKLKEVDSCQKTRYLSPAERTRLCEVINNRTDLMKPMIIIALNTGIRRGSLFALEWDDVNFAERTITLNAENAKSKKQMIIPMNQVVIDALLAWREISEKNKLVFSSPRSGGLLNNVKKTWASILKQAEIENFRWHDMRHDFASQLVMKGVDLNTVRELLGHSDLKITMRYAHLAPGIKRNAVELL